MRAESKQKQGSEPGRGRACEGVSLVRRSATLPVLRALHAPLWFSISRKLFIDSGRVVAVGAGARAFAGSAFTGGAYDDSVGTGSLVGYDEGRY